MILLAFAVLAGGCGPEAEANHAGLSVVATTSILGDITRQLMGSEGTVEVLIPIGADPHSFQASARQAAELRDADLVVANGLALEEALVDILDAVVEDGGRVLEVGPGVDPLPFAGGADGLDPHVWLDPVRGGLIAEAIAAELALLAPARAEQLAVNLASYGQALQSLDSAIAQLLDPIDNRHLVTNHDSLGYLAARYDFEIVGTIIPSGSTLAEPSPRQLADLVDAVNQYGVKAVFVDTTSPTRLAEVLANEAQVEVQVVELFTGSLGVGGSGAETYVDMLRLNATRIAEALI